MEEVSLTALARRTEKRKSSVLWPGVVDERLNALVANAREAGEPDSLSRSEVLAALVVAASDEGEELRRVLERYRRARVADLLATSPDVNDGVIELPTRRPGRRSSRM